MRPKDLLLLVVVIFLFACNCDGQAVESVSPVETPALGASVRAVVNFGNNVYVGSDGSVFAYDCDFVSLNCTLFTTLPNGQEGLSLSGSAFGNSIAVSGTLLVVGAAAYNSFEGAVLLYNCSTTNCTFITSITGSSYSATGSFVAVDGSTVAVFEGFQGQLNLYQRSSTCLSGFELTNIIVDDIALSAAILAIAASTSGGYIYQCEDYTNCTLITSTGSHDTGTSVSISNGLVVFGFAGTDASVFSCTTTSGTVSCGTPFKISNPGSSDFYFASLVSVYNTTVVVSDTSVTVGPYSSVGEVFVYTCTPNGLTVACVGPSEEIIPTSPQANQNFGISLDEISNVVLVGDEDGNLYAVSLQSSNNPTPTSSSAEPTEYASLVATPATPIFSVANSGNNVFVGSPFANSASGNVFAYNCNFVSLACTLFTTLPNGQEDIYSDLMSESAFGWSLAVSGTTLVVGAPFYNSRLGAVLLYDCSTTNCTFITSITGSSISYTGYSVAVYGSTVAVSVLLSSQVNLYQCSSTCSSLSVIPNVFANDLALTGAILAIAALTNGYIYQCANYSSCTQISLSVSGQRIYSVSVSNELVVFGDAGPQGTGLGAVYAVSCITSVPVSCGTLFTIPNPSSYNDFGASVSVYNNTVVVSDPDVQVNGQIDVGEVFVYICTTNNGSASTVTCVGPSEQIIPTSPQANQKLGYAYWSLDETSSGIVLVGDFTGNLYAVSLQSSNNPTPTPTPTPSSSSGAFAGSFTGTLSGTINLKSCSVYLNSVLLSGYPIVDSQNSKSFCCLQKGVLNGAVCVRGSCANPIAFNTFAKIAGDSTDCLVDCVSSSSSSALNSVSVPVLSATSGSIYTGTPQSISASPSQGSYLILNGAYIPVFSFSAGSQQHACLIQGQYDGSSTCHYSTGCNTPAAVTAGFFFYATSESCYITCYPV